MRPIKTILVIAVLALATLAGWRVGSDEVANLRLQDDLRDLASQPRNYIRYSPPRSDEEWRAAVIRKASEDGIRLQPNQVMVEHPGPAAISLSAKYSVPVDLPGFSFTMHFTPSTEKDSF